MDPITHTMAGAAIAASGWRRRTALATPVAMIAANAPDIDIVSYVHGEYAGLALRRGWTHGPIALVVLAVLIPLLALAYDRARRTWGGRKDAGGDAARTPAARAGPLFVLAAIAAVSHPLLDWMNTYGVRWLMPFDARWYYGDALYIIDPWIWLALGVPLFLLHSTRAAAMVAWAVGAGLATTLVLLAGVVPVSARVAWVVVLLLAVAARVRHPASTWRLRTRPLAFGGLGFTAAYIAAMVASDAAASAVTAEHVRSAGVPARSIMVAPVPANPLRGEIVIATADAYQLGTFDWRARPRVRLEGEPVAAGSLEDPIARAAAAAPAARDYLTWSRYPIVRVTADGDGHLVRFSDARYADGRRMGALGGVLIHLDAQLRPR
jgi:inner membrane protein